MVLKQVRNVRRNLVLAAVALALSLGLAFGPVTGHASAECIPTNPSTCPG